MKAAAAKTISREGPTAAGGQQKGRAEDSRQFSAPKDRTIPPKTKRIQRAAKEKDGNGQHGWRPSPQGCQKRLSLVVSTVCHQFWRKLLVRGWLSRF